MHLMTLIAEIMSKFSVGYHKLNASVRNSMDTYLGELVPRCPYGWIADSV